MLSRKFFGNTISKKKKKKIKILKKFNFIIFQAEPLFYENYLKKRGLLKLVTSPFQVVKYVQKFSLFSGISPDIVLYFNSKRFSSNSKN